MSTSPDRQQYRALVADVAARAKEKLPAQVNGRVEKAVALVLQGDVEPQADGSITVYSATDATRRYVLQGTSCTCADYERGQAPEGWCAHRIAAGIQKRVQELLPVQGDNDQLETPSQPLPEAPASVNVRVTIAGHEAQVTLRDTDEFKLMQRLEELLQRYSQPAQPPSQPSEELPRCPDHGFLRRGKRGFYCPVKRPDGTYCSYTGG
jgi:hypothetical protein